MGEQRHRARCTGAPPPRTTSPASTAARRRRRIADPENAQHVYEWLLQETFDATGNHILYEYAKDNPQLYTHEDPSLGLPAIFDRNRNATQLYIRRIYYGNLPIPLLDERWECRHLSRRNRDRTSARRPAICIRSCLRLRRLGDPHETAPPGPVACRSNRNSSALILRCSSEHNPVPIREDRFSSFRAGFEIRTLRRCRRDLDVPPLRRTRRPNARSVHRFRLSQRSRHPPVFPHRCHGHRISKGCGGCLPISRHAAGDVQVFGVPAA